MLSQKDIAYNLMCLYYWGTFYLISEENVPQAIDCWGILWHNNYNKCSPKEDK